MIFAPSQLGLRRWLAVLVAGSSAALALWIYLQRSEVLVPVASRDLPALTRIAQEDVGWRRLPKTALLASTSHQAPVGSMSTRPVLKGETFDRRILVDEPPRRSFGSSALEPGAVAMAVPLSPVNALGGGLQAGDNVMVIVVDPASQRARLLLPQAEVLELRRPAGAAAGVPQSGVAILQLQPEEAPLLAAALSLQDGVFLAVRGSGPLELPDAEVRLFTEGQP